MKDSELIEAIKALPDGEVLVQYASEAGLGLCGHEEWAGVDLKRLADNYDALLKAAKEAISLAHRSQSDVAIGCVDGLHQGLAAIERCEQ